MRKIQTGQFGRVYGTAVLVAKKEVLAKASPCLVFLIWKFIGIKVLDLTVWL